MKQPLFREEAKEVEKSPTGWAVMYRLLHLNFLYSNHEVGDFHTKTPKIFFKTYDHAQKYCQTRVKDHWLPSIEPYYGGIREIEFQDNRWE